MDKIYQALCEAHTAIKWFAFGEAVRLTERIYKVCKAYSRNRENKEVHSQMVKVAKEASKFLLSHSGTPTRDESCKALLDAIQNHQLGS